MRHCTIAVTLLPMSPEPDSFRSRDFIIDQHASGLGNEKKSPCPLWSIDGCKSLFNVKPSTVPTTLIHELYAHTRTTHPERFLGAETPRRPNIPRRSTCPDPLVRTRFAPVETKTEPQRGYRKGLRNSCTCVAVALLCFDGRQRD